VVEMSELLFVGADAALLEGLSQSIAALGCTPVVALTLQDAREQALLDPPLVLLADRALVVGSGADVLAIPLAAGGALVLYAGQHAAAPMLPPALQRAVLAELVLPLERHRLAALVQHVEARARATGRTRRPVVPRPPEPRV
jgi:DNA-binding NtrC family response regulator